MMNKIKEIILYRIRYWVIIMDLLFILSPFLCLHLFGPENSYVFLGLSIAWIFLNISKGKVNKERYLLKVRK